MIFKRTTENFTSFKARVFHLHLFFLIFLFLSLSFFSSLAIAYDQDDFVSRYPWVDTYKYIKEHPDALDSKAQLDMKVLSLQKQIEKTLVKKENQLQEQQDNEFLIETKKLKQELSEEQKEKLSEDITYIESNIDNLGPNLKALLLKRLNEFQSLTNQSKN